MTERSEGRRGRLIEVASVDNVVEAEVLRQVLEDGGVRCLLQNADALSAYSAGGVARRIAVLVLEDDAARARALIGDLGQAARG